VYLTNQRDPSALSVCVGSLDKLLKLRQDANSAQDWVLLGSPSDSRWKKIWVYIVELECFGWSPKSLPFGRQGPGRQGSFKEGSSDQSWGRLVPAWLAVSRMRSACKGALVHLPKFHHAPISLPFLLIFARSSLPVYILVSHSTTCCLDKGSSPASGSFSLPLLPHLCSNWGLSPLSEISLLMTGVDSLLRGSGCPTPGFVQTMKHFSRFTIIIVCVTNVHIIMRTAKGTNKRYLASLNLAIWDARQALKVDSELKSKLTETTRIRNSSARGLGNRVSSRARLRDSMSENMTTPNFKIPKFGWWTAKFWGEIWCK